MKLIKCKCGGMKRKGYKQCRQCFLNHYKNRTHKHCNGCDQDLLLNQFRLRMDGTRPRSKCKKCEANSYRQYKKNNVDKVKKAKRSWYKRNPDKVKLMAIRRFCKKTNISFDKVKTYMDGHSRLCDICGNPPHYFKYLSIDHCHTTGEFRGLLCANCNNGLGFFKDNPLLFDKAKEYLLTHSLPTLRTQTT